MKYIKTALGQDVMKSRSIPLGPRQRTVLLLCDGQRDEREVLAATSGMGASPADFEELLELGVIEPLLQSAVVQGAAAPAPELAMVDLPIEPEPIDQGERFRLAYQQATQLTATLGLRGFRLQLAVEHAMNLTDLEALTGRLQEAMITAHGPQKGPEKMARFEELLHGG